ncbi:MAG: hypothetical protein JWL62_2100 [Hyphomicrobiales bacterium]|nr:hypothetical protein [Hyphomicrobiales bacterium]
MDPRQCGSIGAPRYRRKHRICRLVQSPSTNVTAIGGFAIRENVDVTIAVSVRHQSPCPGRASPRAPKGTLVDSQIVGQASRDPENFDSSREMIGGGGSRGEPGSAPNSLLSAEIQGNFGIYQTASKVTSKFLAARQQFLGKFPARDNRELFSRNRKHSGPKSWPLTQIRERSQAVSCQNIRSYSPLPLLVARSLGALTVRP